MTIGAALHHDPIINSPTLVRRIQKLGDYYNAVQSITKALMDPAILKLKTAIHFIEVSLSPYL